MTAPEYKADRHRISNALINEWVRRGFAVVHSEAPGTGLSQGCPTVGAEYERMPMKFVVDWLNGRAKGYTTPTGTVLTSDEDTNVSAYTKSCMLNVKAKIATVSMPARLSGRITRGMAPSREQPSTIAASSISTGIVRKKPAMSHVQNGIVNVG